MSEDQSPRTARVSVLVATLTAVAVFATCVVVWGLAFDVSVSNPDTWLWWAPGAVPGVLLGVLLYRELRRPKR